MKRICFVLLLGVIAFSLIASGKYWHRSREFATSTTTSGVGADTTYTYDTIVLAKGGPINSLIWRIILNTSTTSLRGAGLEDSAWVMIKTRAKGSSSYWITLDSIRTALPDTSSGRISRLDGDTLFMDEIIAIIHISDTASDSAMAIGWTGDYNVIAKE